MQHLQPNTTLQGGKYKIERAIGEGGFSNTYVAINLEFNERYALKEFFWKGVAERDETSSVVSVSNANNTQQFEAQREKFKKEARRLRQLNNTHIVKVYDLFEENGTAYYVMDYVDGENLSTRLKRTNEPLTETEVRNILPQVLDALKAVHAAGIWHLDLKPANIMVDKSGNVKLIDFGASKQLNAQKGGATTSTAISYTNGYAPREQMEQNYDKFGPWTDIYALGATLYALLTNKRPPLPTDIDDDISDDKHVALPFPATVSEEMKSLVLKMMKTNRMQRPQSVEEVKLESAQTPQSATIQEETQILSPKPANEKNSEETIIAEAPKDGWGRATWIDEEASNNGYIAIPYIYEGEFKNGKCNGKGTLYMYNGNIVYEGEFKNGIKNGKGIEYDRDGTILYEGEFRNGEFCLALCNGKVTYTYSDGSKYEGEFKDGKHNGYGKYTYSDGSKCEGEFKDGVLQKGTIIYSNGDKYEVSKKEAGKVRKEILKEEYIWEGIYTYSNGKKKKIKIDASFDFYSPQQEMMYGQESNITRYKILKNRALLYWNSANLFVILLTPILIFYFKEITGRDFIEAANNLEGWADIICKIILGGIFILCILGIFGVMGAVYIHEENEINMDGRWAIDNNPWKAAGNWIFYTLCICATWTGVLKMLVEVFWG